MKRWIWFWCLLTLSQAAEAQSFRIVWSPSLKLAAYLDNVKSARVSSWCDAVLPLRIEPQKKYDPDAVARFLPLVGELMKKECPELRTLNWQVVDAKGHLQQRGTAASKNHWQVTPEPATEADGQPQPTPTQTAISQPQPVQNANSQPQQAPPQSADITPASRFDTPADCHFRTYWSSETGDALFFSTSEPSLTCDDQRWLNGPGKLQHQQEGKTREDVLLFLSGYPLLNLPLALQKMPSSIVTANNQRLILASAQAPDSWLIVPYDPALHVWRFSGLVAVKNPQQDISRRQALLEHLRHQWGLADTATPLTFKLIEQLQPQWRDPAAMTLATVKLTGVQTGPSAQPEK